MSPFLFRGHLQCVLLCSVMAALNIYFSNVRGYHQGFPELSASSLFYAQILLCLLRPILLANHCGWNCQEDMLSLLVVIAPAMVVLFCCCAGNTYWWTLLTVRRITFRDLRGHWCVLSGNNDFVCVPTTQCN